MFRSAKQLRSENSLATDEINRHFSNFHGYKSLQHCTETWYQVSVDTSPVATPSIVQSGSIQEDVPITPITPIASITQYVTCHNGHQSVQTSCTPAPYCHGPAPYCEEDTPPPDSGPAHPELTSVPGMDYSMILQPQIRKSWDSMENANKKRK